MIRFLLAFTFILSTDLLFFILAFAFLSFLYSSLMAFSQIDIKKIIAYSSIAHMNFLLFGLFSQNILGLLGSFYMVFGHSLTSSALFFGIGVLYDRYKTRLLFYYSSLMTFMPVFSLFYFIFLLSNFAFPFTVNFVGEFLIGLGGLILILHYIFLMFFLLFYL